MRIAFWGDTLAEVPLSRVAETGFEPRYSEVGYLAPLAYTLDIGGRSRPVFALEVRNCRCVLEPVSDLKIFCLSI